MHALSGFSRKREREAEISRWYVILPFGEDLHRGGPVTSGDRRECKAKRGARARVTQLQRIVEAGPRGQEAARLEVRGAERRAIGSVARVGQHGSLSIGNGFTDLALLQGNFGLA